MSSILIVDDRPVNRQFLTTLLRYKGYETREAEDGVDALAVVSEWSPDLAIVDIRMPRMSGVEFVRTLQAMPLPLSALPVIFYTATYREPEAYAMAASCGVRAVLTKPAAPDVVLSTVERILGLPAPAAVIPAETLVDRLQRTQSRLANLLEFSIDLASEPGREIILEKFARAARRIVEADGALVCVCQSSSDEQRHAASGAPAELLLAQLSPGGPLCAICRLAEGDASRDPLPAAADDVGAMLHAAGLSRPYLLVPLTFPSSRHGLLVLIGREAAAPFTDDDRSLALTLALQAGITYDNVVLYESLEESRRVLERRVEERTAELKRERDRLTALARELSDSNQELETFNYSVSHDLRAPLRAIDGFTALALAAGSGMDEKSRGYFERVHGAARRMTRLIDDLMELSRVGRVRLDKQRVDVSALARELVADLAAASPDRTVEVAIDDGILAHADVRILRIVLANLLGNAWKFTARKEHARIELLRHSSNGHDTFVVRDNGAGFDLRNAEKLFGAFQRFHPASEFEGNGIGLATVQRIIRRHGGTIWAESEPGRGASFFVSLPSGHGRPAGAAQ